MPAYRCRWRGCRRYLTESGYCSEHQTAADRVHNEARGFYRSREWLALARLVKQRAGNCCEAPGCYTRERLIVHHRRPRPRNTPRLTPLDVPENLICLCQRCHNRVEADIRADRQSRLRDYVGS
jgi:hypothetical protein